MPLYDLTCKNHHPSSVILKSWKDPNPPCEACGEPTTREVSAPAFILRGAGFHNVDYAHGPTQTASKAHSPARAKKHGLGGATTRDGKKLRPPSDPRRTNGFVSRPRMKV